MTAEIVPDEGKRLPRELWRKYLGVDLPAAKNGEERAIIRVAPRRIVGALRGRELPTQGGSTESDGDWEAGS